MIWTIPKITQISIGMEINCYACAELQALQIQGERGIKPLSLNQTHIYMLTLVLVRLCVNFSATQNTKADIRLII